MSRLNGFADEPELCPAIVAPRDALMEDCVSDSMILYLDSASFFPSEMESRTLWAGAAERGASQSRRSSECQICALAKR